jgi:nitrile hydratase
MNGIHDMGGMHGMGHIQHEKKEPVFHQRWESRAFALLMATWELVPKGVSVRFAIEQIPPAEYLRMSYYERWLESREHSGQSRCSEARGDRAWETCAGLTQGEAGSHRGASARDGQ